MRIALIRELLHSFKAVDDKAVWQKIWRDAVFESQTSNPLRHWLSVTFIIASLLSILISAVLNRMTIINASFFVAQISALLPISLIIGNSLMVNIDKIAVKKITTKNQQ